MERTPVRSTGTLSTQTRSSKTEPADASCRSECVASVLRRAAEAGKTAFYMLDTGHIEPIKAAKRDGKFAKGEAVVPPTACYACVAGDSHWQPLPGAVTTEAVREAGAAKRKADRIAKDRSAKQSAYAETAR